MPPTKPTAEPQPAPAPLARCPRCFAIHEGVPFGPRCSAIPDATDEQRNAILGVMGQGGGPCPVCGVSHNGPPLGPCCGGSTGPSYQPGQVLHCPSCGGVHQAPACDAHAPVRIG